MKLTVEETNSALWKKLADHLRGRIEMLRMRNDHHQSEDSTSRLRGQIAELKGLLGLAEADPALEGVTMIADTHEPV